MVSNEMSIKGLMLSEKASFKRLKTITYMVSIMWQSRKGDTDDREQLCGCH